MDSSPSQKGETEKVYAVLCAAGFDQIDRARSAFMFASLAAAAGMRSVIFCVQDGAELLVRGAIERREKIETGHPTLTDRIHEAQEAGVEIWCCTQTMANRGIEAADLLPEVAPRGAMSFIDISARARACLSF